MPEEEEYVLSSHVHLCVAGGSIVLLDLRQDRYLAVSPSQSEYLTRRVRGWPSAGSGRLDQAPRTSKFAQRSCRPSVLEQHACQRNADDGLLAR
jgi:hypothetical protein